MKQDLEIYRDTGILGAAMAVKEKLDEQSGARKNSQQTMGGL